jgi:hypothetical protein
VIALRGTGDRLPPESVIESAGIRIRHTTGCTQHVAEAVPGHLFLVRAELRTLVFVEQVHEMQQLGLGDDAVPASRRLESAAPAQDRCRVQEVA